ncbi:membrane protein insertase YidC [Candidatus Saccharibacteria bacterium]|jgi:YidC/Oxa1 family membrane protein insertase|nr:membrane protein insertase YidC [Candidatus Saccharibacteria bacterium]HOR23066.1 YidC/Oxa1 family membrane protein insertase [Candidatus Saccharibacteria bacterium]
MFQVIGKLFNALIAQPIFNLLILIIALIPSHDFGIAIIIFTIIVRLVLYPLLRKQLHNTMAMKKLQPELKRIKKESKGNRQKESQLMMALYKEKGVNPFSSFAIILIQLPILIALYAGIRKIVDNPHQLLDLAYSWMHQLPYLENLTQNIHVFSYKFLGLIDLSKFPISKGGLYWPAMVLVVLSVAIQYLQSKQLLMSDKNTRSLRQLLKDTAAGKEVDQSEVQAATSKMTLFFVPAMIFMVSVSLPAALSLYWLVGGLVAYIQQTYILKKDVIEMEASVDEQKVEAEIIYNKKDKKPKSTSKKRSKNKRKRR